MRGAYDSIILEKGTEKFLKRHPGSRTFGYYDSIKIDGYNIKYDETIKFCDSFLISYVIQFGYDYYDPYISKSKMKDLIFKISNFREKKLIKTEIEYLEEKQENEYIFYYGIYNSTFSINNKNSTNFYIGYEYCDSP